MLHFFIKESSAVSDVSYNPENDELYITFNSGATNYTYFNVPFSAVIELTSADSVGKAFHKVIKNKYEFKNLITVGEAG